VAQNGEIDVDQSIRGLDPLPSECRTAETIDDPLVTAQQTCVRLQKVMLGNFDASRRELHHVHYIEW
jgi:hypothetical protein